MKGLNMRRSFTPAQLPPGSSGLKPGAATTVTRHMSKRAALAGLLAALMGFANAPARADVTFSTDPSYSGNPADIRVDSSAASLGLTTGDNLTSYTTGVVGNVYRFFSVDRDSYGLAGTGVAKEATHGGQAADVFLSGSFCRVANCLVEPYAYLGLSQSDNVDGLMMFGTQLSQTVLFFTLGRGSPTLTTLGASPADILVRDRSGDISVFLTASALGLSVNDAIDALEINMAIAPMGPPFFLSPTDTVTYSLDRASTSGPPASLFLFTGGVTTEGIAASLGLRSTDNIDAIATSFIDCFSQDTGTVANCPEPASIALFATGLGAMGALTRRRRGAAGHAMA